MGTRGWLLAWYFAILVMLVTCKIQISSVGHMIAISAVLLYCANYAPFNDHDHVKIINVEFVFAYPAWVVIPTSLSYRNLSEFFLLDVHFNSDICVHCWSGCRILYSPRPSQPHSHYPSRGCPWRYCALVLCKQDRNPRRWKQDLVWVTDS